MAEVLTVHAPFGKYERGAQITDAAEIKAILEGERADSVTRSVHEDPAPEPVKAEEPKE